MTRPVLSFAGAIADLDGRQPDRMIPTLERIRMLAMLLGDPQLTYPTIHVTGTNGKTTTARLITDLACAHGLTTGLYTSPHLLSVTERLQICGQPISEHELAGEYAHLLPFAEEVDRHGERVTYFELLTALAYLWFADKPVALGVYEVGMGGTWDATSLVAGDVAVIGEIGLDHPELGSTVREVAGEKAGIIKRGKIAVTRAQVEDAMAVIEDRAAQMHARLLVEERDFGLEDRATGLSGQTITVAGLHSTYDEVFLSLLGDHAGHNAAIAIVALEAFLGRGLDDEAVREALGNATSPGRLEVVSRRPLVILDGAHNPAGAEALASAVRELFSWDRLHLVLAISSNKDLTGIVMALAPLADRAYAARNQSSRSADADTVFMRLAEHGVPVEAFGSVADALDAARQSAGDGDAVLVTGSLYTVADARRAIGV